MDHELETTERAGYFFKTLPTGANHEKHVSGREYVGGKAAYVRLLQKNAKP
jgi:hypothetical protein